MKRSKHRGRYRERLGLAERLKAERKRRGLRQVDAAREIGICRETLALIEVHHIPSQATLDKIDHWMATTPPRPERPRASATGERPAGRRAAAGLGVFASLAVRRQAERAYRLAQAARAKRGRRKRVRKGKKDGKADQGSGLG